MNMAKQLREKLGVTNPAQGKVDFQIQYGHTDTHIVVMFGRMINNLTLSVEQLDDMLKSMNEVRAALVNHQKGKKNVGA